MCKRNILIILITSCFIFPDFSWGISGDEYLSKGLYYSTLVDFTCQLQIDYYRELSEYLEQTRASNRPLLIPYYTGVAYFEMGDYQQAAQLFKEAADRLAASDLLPSVKNYQYYAQVMHAACLYQLGEKKRLENLIKKKKKQAADCFLGYILLRLNYRTKLAKNLLADCPENIFGEVTKKWIGYRLGLLPLKDLKVVKYKLKKPEYEESYDQIKLDKGEITLGIKYFNPVEITLLKEIYLYKALKSFDLKDTKNFSSLGLIRYLLGDFEGAIQYLEDYQRAFPLNLSAPVWLGQCYFANNELQKADRIWDWVRKSGGKRIKQKLALVLSSVKQRQQDAVMLFEKNGDKGIMAKQRFDAAYYRKYKDYYQTLGRIYLNRKKFKQAAENLMLTYERSRKEQPQSYDQTYLLCLGYALAKTGRFKESIDYALKGAASLDTAAYQAFYAVNYGLYMLKYE